ncbi:S-adenosyl-L-methionine-dependent methyltransferase [Phanerochaete sordida]|uniref:DNA (cytosine-5-)-methyltransferase n=1 Tax=Phanerochaete sordida TaxID=48140 RepID=A0A9P3LCD7_9APHY|nr:S-adenosyl-L-methionine-dependent methyltransferase [Phanerochaete sordida]
MPPRNRPTALDVTDGYSSSHTSLDTSSNWSPFARSATRTPASTSTLASSSRSYSPASSAGARTLVGTPRDAQGKGGKRRYEDIEKDRSQAGKGKQPEKRTRSSQAQKPRIPTDALENYDEEGPRTFVDGEDADDVDPSGDNKPIRTLTDFFVCDHGTEEHVSLEGLFDSESRSELRAYGDVGPMLENEEDAVLDDDAEDAPKRRLRTTAINGFSLDYTSLSHTVYIQTRYAWYALKTPAKEYAGTWKSFYRPHLIAQLIMSYATRHPARCTKESMRKRFVNTYREETGDQILNEDIDQAERILIELLQDAESDVEDDMPQDNANPYAEALKSAYIRDLRDTKLPARGGRRAWNNDSKTRRKLYNTTDLDLLVHRPGEQNITTITPLVSRLSDGLFMGEQFHVLGGQQHTEDQRRAAEKQQRQLLVQFLRRAQEPAGRVDFPMRFEVQRHSDFWAGATADGVTYEVGDVVLVSAGQFKGRAPPGEIPAHVEPDGSNIPAGAALWDYFWFAQIMYFNLKKKTVHLRWFEHSSKTVMQEIFDPHELFLTDICDDADVRALVGKIEGVEHRQQPLLKRQHGRFSHNPPRPPRENGRFFYSFKYSDTNGAFVGLSDSDVQPPFKRPPDNCPVCLREAERLQTEYPQVVEGGKGVAYRGTNYHVHDFAMIRVAGAPVCMIAQIIGIAADNSARRQGSCNLQVVPLGRFNDIVHLCEDEDAVKDERHLYIVTDTEAEYIEVNAADLIRRCHVANCHSLPHYWARDLAAYLAASPYHFYAKYRFPRLAVARWRDVRPLSRGSRCPDVCAACFRADEARVRALRDFTDARARRPLRAFDPFGGVGAFALAMQDAGCMKLTHAIEISPSAALTLKKNSPDTVVYNQCANRILAEAVKKVRIAGHQLPPNYKPIFKDSATLAPLPPPLKPGDIDCIVAGFPCQPHSRMNMFQKADDRKSHLILNLLSWVDFLEPKFCYFENVRGFLQYNLNAVQASRYKVSGGIQMGGFKFLVRALLTMGYQVRFAVLQAAHYGTPQTRVRFFLIAAQLGQPLPNLPTPLYSFPNHEALEIKFLHGLSVRPVLTERSAMPFRHVSVDDAIGDLLRWDWVNPREKRRDRRERADPATGRRIPAVEVEKLKKAVGPLAPGAVRYHGPPRTRFQQQARARQDAIRDLQHITRVLKPDTVARVTLIPLEQGADYHALLQNPAVPVELLEWHWADPKSAVARKGFRNGLYGRLDPATWFQTTVTNVEPTAKQCKVLNPYCKRVVSVRELARSQGFPDHFQFYCYGNLNVKTMQREIGNAVPWPVGYALGRELRDALFEDWLLRRPDDSDVVTLDSDD